MKNAYMVIIGIIDEELEIYDFGLYRSQLEEIKSKIEEKKSSPEMTFMEEVINRRNLWASNFGVDNKIAIRLGLLYNRVKERLTYEY